MRWFRRSQQVEQVRPRFGQLTGPNGEQLPVVFHPDPDNPNHFVGKLAGNESQATLGEGWSLSVDVIGPGQSIEIRGEYEL